MTVKFLNRVFRCFGNEVDEEMTWASMLAVLKNKGYVQSCSKYTNNKP